MVCQQQRRPSIPRRDSLSTRCCLTVREGGLRVLLWEGLDEGPALPGGFVRETESAERAVTRHLAAKAGVDTPPFIEQLACFTDPARDHRGWIPSVAYVALVPPGTEPSNPGATWVSATSPPTLLYDHLGILELALDRVRGKLWWSNVAVGILAGPFTMTAAREVYEAIAEKTYDPSTFARDLNATTLIEATGDFEMTTRGRPAALYRFKSREPAWGIGRRKRMRD